jgi:hypothetical protein
MRALAEEHHVSPFVAAVIRRTAMELPDGVETQIERIERESAIAGFLWCAELRGLLRAFASSGIPLLPLKGPFLAQRIYGGESLRLSRDLDLLVRKQDLPAAEALMHSLGFSPTGISDDYHRPWLRGTTGVELHFDVENPLAFDFGTAEAWRNAKLSSFAGEPAWMFAEQDEILFLALHGVRHRFERLSHVLDLALAMEQYASSGAAEPPRKIGNLQPVLDLGIAMANKLRPNPSVPASVPRPHIARLAEWLWDQLMNEMQHTMDWQEQHRFYLELESSLPGRLAIRFRHARILFSRLIGPDYEFAARFGCKRRWQVWLLRPVRLIVARAANSSRKSPEKFGMSRTER